MQPVVAELGGTGHRELAEAELDSLVLGHARVHQRLEGGQERGRRVRRRPHDAVDDRLGARRQDLWAGRLRSVALRAGLGWRGRRGGRGAGRAGGRAGRRRPGRRHRGRRRGGRVRGHRRQRAGRSRGGRRGFLRRGRARGGGRRGGRAHLRRREDGKKHESQEGSPHEAAIYWCARGLPFFAIAPIPASAAGRSGPRSAGGW